MENRKHKRFKIANLSKIEDHDYSIINIREDHAVVTKENAFVNLALNEVSIQETSA